MNVLIIGNILKDVYLRLDEQKNSFEIDENQTPWLDLAFDGSTHNFFKRSSIFGGATVSLDVLSRFGHEAKIVGARLNFKYGEVDPNGQIPAGYRYILCKENHISYLAPNVHETTVWENPTDAIDWLFIDRSAGISKELVKEIKNFLSMSSHTRVAMYVSKNLNEDARELVEIADLIFSDGEYRGPEKPAGAVCEIFENKIKLGEAHQDWRVERTDLMTRLTTHSIISATIFAMLLNGKSVRESLKYAELNVENSSLIATLSPKNLEELLGSHDNSEADIAMIAAQMVAPKKGILAADESGGSIQKKFAQLDIPDDEQHRRDYRNIFLSTDELEKYVNGVILFEETTHQKTDDGQNFVEFLTAKGIIPGIKVDQGLVNFENSEEKYTKGLEDLPKRLNGYYEQGLRFAKWRAAFEITNETPSEMAIEKNCEILAEYAKDCQAAGIVPIVEPEVVHDGDYTIEKCAEVTGQILRVLFEKLAEKSVRLEGCILKCNMVLAGKKYPIQSTSEEVGRATAEVLKANVPENLAGVVFLSGGQTVEQATANLGAVEKNGPFPWPVTFSFARALQDPALYAWKGNNENYEEAKAAFKKRLIANTEVL